MRFLERGQKEIIGMGATSVLMALVFMGGKANAFSFAPDAGTEQVRTSETISTDDSEQITLAEANEILSTYKAENDLEFSGESVEDDVFCENEDAATTGISMDNVEYVATLIESEAGNVKSFDGRVSIALTAFKRVESNKYPDTLVEVVEQPYQYADLVGRYSEESYDAAVKAISLWEEGTDETVLPDGYLYFFGYKQQNWFYRRGSDGCIEFYALPGQTITDDVWQAFRRIVLKEVPAAKASEEVQEAIGEILEDAESEAPVAASEDTIEETSAAGSSETIENITEEAATDTATEAVSAPTAEDAIMQDAEPSST